MPESAVATIGMARPSVRNVGSTPFAKGAESEAPQFSMKYAARTECDGSLHARGSATSASWSGATEAGAARVLRAHRRGETRRARRRSPRSPERSTRVRLALSARASVDAYGAGKRKYAPVAPLRGASQRSRVVELRNDNLCAATSSTLPPSPRPAPRRGLASRARVVSPRRLLPVFPCDSSDDEHVMSRSVPSRHLAADATKHGSVGGLRQLRTYSFFTREDERAQDRDGIERRCRSLSREMPSRNSRAQCLTAPRGCPPRRPSELIAAAPEAARSRTRPETGGSR